MKRFQAVWSARGGGGGGGGGVRNGQRQLQTGHGQSELLERKYKTVLNIHKVMGWVISIYRSVNTLCTARFSFQKTGNVRCLVCIVLLSSYVYLLYCVCVYCCFTLDAGLLVRSQYSEGPATGHLDTGSSWLPCVYKQMLRWFPTFQVATTCFSCSPPDVNLLVTNFMFCLHVK